MDRNAKKRFKQILRNIKTLKIQGATNIAKAGLKAYFIRPRKSTIKKLKKIRLTEPLLFNVLYKAERNKLTKKSFDEYLKESQKKINKFVFLLLKKRKRKKAIYTHCHSSTVVNALIYSKKQKIKFEVYNTETRPLYQGRKTAKQLAKAGINVTTFVDAALSEALNKSDIILIGADAILTDGVINKIGSKTIAELSKIHQKPLYIVSNSWKFYYNKIKIEERDFHEVWNKKLKNLDIRNPAFEKVPKRYIRAIISEFGILSYKDFLRKVSSNKK